MDTKPNEKQLKVALEQIVQLAQNVDELYYNCESIAAVEDSSLRAVRFLVNQIGAIADRCLDYESYGLDHWLLPPSFKLAEDQSKES